MTVWSVERLSADAKKRFGQSTGCLRLPRARSTPTSRHWMLHPDARAAAVAAPSLGHTAPGSSMRHSRRCSPAARPSDVGNHSMKGDVTYAMDMRIEQAEMPHSRRSSPAARPCDMGNHSVKGDVTHAMDMRIEQAEMRRVRQASDARGMRGGADKPNVHAAELFQGPLSAQNQVLPSGEDALVPDVSASVPIATGFVKTVHREPKRLSRQLSVPSEEAMSQLCKLDAQLRDIEQRVEQLHSFARGQSLPTCESVGQMRTALAQLEADANKLETKGVDSIYTSELRSGQVCAKEAKKAQICRLETLFVAIEDLFRFLAEAARNL